MKGLSRCFRLEALLLGLLLVKLGLSGLWLVAGPAPSSQAIAAEGKAAPVKQAAPDSEIRLLERQREELARREERLQRREADLTNLSADVEARLEQLARLKEELKSLLVERDKRRNKQIKLLVQVYSNMKAEKAAGLIDKLDDQVVVEIFSQMPSENAGKILSFVEPEKAARISQRLAELR
jgi:flagellar motility protein MotE (MotC chaperone)